MCSTGILSFALHPRRVSEALKEHPGWLWSFSLLAALSIVLDIVVHPSLVHRTIQLLPAGATALDRIAVRDWLDSALPIRCAVLPIRLLAGWGSFSLFLWLLVRAFEPVEHVRWTQVFALAVRAEGILLAGRILGVAWGFLHYGGHTAWRAIPGNLADVIPFRGDFTVLALLTSVNLFTLWYGVTLALGVSVLAGFSGAKSLSLVTASWIVSAGLNLGIISLLHNAFQFAL